MLHHEDPLPTDALGSAAEPAAQVRVTAEELARAVARYQARREEAAQRLEGTLTLGEAVQELGLDMTPEELLAEVQSERTVPQAPKKAKKPRFGIVSGIGAVLLFGSVLMMAFTQESAPPPAPMPIISVPGPLVSHSVTAPTTILVQDANGPKPVLRTLGEIPDGRPVQAALDQTNLYVKFVGFSDPTTSWTLIKHGGRVYVRAWIPAMSPKAMQTSAVNLYHHKSLVPSGIAPQAVTIPIDGIQCSPGVGDDDMIDAQHIQPDSHFNESW